MNRPTIPSHPLLHTLILTLGVCLCPLSVLADEPDQIISEPGFRPPSEHAANFLDNAGAMQIAVLPTIVRRVERTAHSFASQQQIVDYLNESGTATARVNSLRIDLGPLRRRSQWEIFQYGALSVAEKLKGREPDADYTFVMEILVPGDQSVFGIELYIMDPQGRSAFSFLLNSHHELFVDAKLVARDSSEEAREKMIENATRVGLLALEAQMEQARDCIAASSEFTTTAVEPGVLHDFQSKLASGTSRNGAALGFSTFSDGTSTVNISRTGSHPPLPEEKTGNRVLQLDLDVTGWAGILHLTSDEGMQRWAPQDWSSMDGFSFWLHGNNSATKMFFDVLDNRQACSRRDDAERYTYVFWDDVPGWRLISVPFKDMARKEINNGAPNDGLNLTEVHGWGLGSVNTDGPKTFYIDDFRLWRSATEAESAPHEVIEHELFIETRLDDDTSRLEVRPDRQKGLVVDKVLNLACAWSQLTIDRGYRYFKTDERARLSDDRATMRITFYKTLPDGVAVGTRLLQEGNTESADLMTAAIDAEEFTEVCDALKNQP